MSQSLPLARRIALTLLLFLLITSTGTPSGAARAAEPAEIPLEPGKTFVHGPSKFEFPVKVGSFEREEAHQFDVGGQNVAVGYRDGDDGIVATVYVYPDRDVALAEHFAQVKGDVARVFRGAKVESEGEWTLKQGDRKYAGLRAAFTVKREIDGEQRQLASRVYLVDLNGRFIKFRITYSADKRAAAEKKIEAFLAALTLPKG